MKALWGSPSKRIRARGARGKTIVFCLFKSNGRVYTEIVSDCLKATLQAIIRGRVELESIIHSDGGRGYDGLLYLGYQILFRMEYGSNGFANRHSHINGIESFWRLPGPGSFASAGYKSIPFIFI